MKSHSWGIEARIRQIVRLYPSGNSGRIPFSIPGSSAHVYAKMLNAAGSVASIISLVLTGWAVWEVRRLHQSYRRHLVLPQSGATLIELMKGVRKAIQKKQTDELARIFLRCDAIIERMPKYADKTLSDRIQTSRTSIDRVLVNRDQLLDEASDLIGEIEALVQSAADFTGEDKWSTKT